MCPAPPRLLHFSMSGLHSHGMADNTDKQHGDSFMSAPDLSAISRQLAFLSSDLAGVDFSLLTPDVADQVRKLMDALPDLSGSLERLARLSNSPRRAPEAQPSFFDDSGDLDVDVLRQALVEGAVVIEYTKRDGSSRSILATRLGDDLGETMPSQDGRIFIYDAEDGFTKKGLYIDSIDHVADYEPF